MIERRKSTVSKSSPLPVDYLQMVTEVFTANFDAGLKIYGQHQKNPFFKAFGEVFSDEVILFVSLMSENELSATTVYASSDFDPKASAPTIQDLLSACVDAIGGVFNPLLDTDHPEMIEQLANSSLSALENAPFHWTPLESNQRQIFVKLDKSNPKMDQLADDWLKKHDPDFLKQQAEEEKDTEKLFVLGPKPKNDSSNN